MGLTMGLPMILFERYSMDPMGIPIWHPMGFPSNIFGPHGKSQGNLDKSHGMSHGMSHGSHRINDASHGGSHPIGSHGKYDAPQGKSHGQSRGK